MWIDDTEFTIFDTETTGLNPYSGDRVIEIAAIRFKAGKRLGDFESLVKTEREISAGAFAVNRITPEMLEKAPSAQEVFPKLMRFIEGSMPCSYNAGFDLDFLSNELALLGLKIPEEVIFIDILKMAKRLMPGLERYALWFIAEKMGISRRQEHRALSDTIITWEVFNRLKDVLAQKGIYTLANFKELFTINKNFLDNVNARKINRIREAIHLGVKLKIRYLTSSSAVVSEREVLPKEVKVQDGQSYLVGYCFLRKEERSFRTDGILHIEGV